MVHRKIKPKIIYHHPAIIINSSAFEAEKLVYVGIANKPYRYEWGTSRIVYIGTTEKGASRIANSAVWKAREILNLYGFNELKFYIIKFPLRQGVKIWPKLERALILTFRRRFGEPPLGNIQGGRSKWKDEDKYFNRQTLDNLISKIDTLK